MRKQMMEVSVYTQDSEIIIEQPIPFEGASQIILDLAQIDIVISWLKEAKEELNG